MNEKSQDIRLDRLEDDIKKLEESVDKFIDENHKFRQAMRETILGDGGSRWGLANQVKFMWGAVCFFLTIVTVAITTAVTVFVKKIMG